MADWNAVQYLRFKKERTQPARDLLAAVTQPAPRRVVDLGCGPGNSTALLAARYPDAQVVGIDNSPAMLKRAKQAHPELMFEAGDASRGLTEPSDLIFSNACLQWLPDHQTLLPRLLASLNPGGMLAVQIPMNGQAPLYQIIAQVAAKPVWGFSEAIAWTNRTLLPLQYHDLLAAHASNFRMWETTYYHCLPDHQALLDWVRSTRLRPYLAQLTKPKQAAFEAEILKEARQAYPVAQNGEVSFTFRRFFFIATK